MTIIVSLFICSFVGMSAMLCGRLISVRKMSEREFVLSFRETSPVFWDIYRYTIIPLKSFWVRNVKPVFFMGMERTLSKVRVSLLFVENLLLKFNNYLHSKAIDCKNTKKTEYWGNIDSFKKSLKTKKKT